MVNQPLLSVKDVMKHLNVSRRTIYYWIDKGMLKPVRLGGVYRFHPEDMDILLEKSRVGEGGRKKKILAIDDDILVRESLKSLLAREGFEITMVSSGTEALDLLSKEAFDLILTDMRMPGMNGIETLKAIREARAKFGKDPLPEIILTAYDEPGVREEAKKLGVKDFLMKPFDLNEFVGVLRKQLSSPAPSPKGKAVTP